MTMASEGMSHTADSTKETHAVSELLGDTGNCRQSILPVLNLHLLNDSIVSEQQKLRVVLDWAHMFLSSSPDVDNDICRYDAQQRGTEKAPPAPNSAAVSCTAGVNEQREKRGNTKMVWQPQLSDFKDGEQNNYLSRHKPPTQEDLQRDGVAWPENRETQVLGSIALQHGTRSHHSCRRSQVHASSHRHGTHLSHSRSNQTFTLDAASCWSNASKNSTGALSAMEMLPQNCDSTDMINTRELTGNEKEPRKESEEGKPEKKQTERGRMEESSSASVASANDNQSSNESEKIPTQMANAASPSSTYHLKIPSNLTVYEQYQLCVAQLRHLRLRKSTEEEKTAPEEGAAAAEARALPASSSTSPELKQHLNEVQSRRSAAAGATGEGASDTTHQTKNRTTRARETALTKHAEVKVDPSADETCLHLSGNSDGFIKRRVEADEGITRRVEHRSAAPADVEASAELAANPGVKCHEVGVEGRDQGGLCEHSHRTRQQTRPRSSGASKCATRPNTQTLRKGHTPEDRANHAKTHTRLHGNSRPASASTAHDNINNTGCEYSPAGVPACDWLSLPDEVWLPILSLLPLCDLCTAVRVCSRLHALATDHTLWKSVRMENVTLTEQWLLSVAKRRPRSLCLYSCSSHSVTSCGLKMVFTLCRNTLEEVSVTCCVGPGLHGDQMLPLVAQLCDRVTSVDVSWSGATDRGVKALSDGVTGLRLKSVLLNGCHITDDPLKKLVMRHKQSLCRLEVFGCQFLTATCLQTVYQMCPGLQHLNIGQVPKVNTLSLAAMTSHLKSLISLNLTGLKAVTDAILDTLLQNCVALQILKLSSCPGVTDLTLHNISKYAHCIRSLDVSGCKAITDTGVQFLTLGCDRLQRLDLSATGTGSRGVALLANHLHLRTVKLSFCHIGLEDILELCRRCMRLKELHLYGCAQLPTERQLRDINATVQVFPLP